MAIFEPIQFQAKNGKAVQLRSLRVGEGAVLLATVLEIMRTSQHLLTLPDEFTLSAEQEDEVIQKYWDHPDKIFIAAECEGRIVGILDFCIGSKRKISHTGDFGMSLLAEFRGTGIGFPMLREFLDWARKNPRIERVALRVHAKNTAALGLYRKLGFREEGRELRGVKLDDGSYDDVIVMAIFVK